MTTASAVRIDKEKKGGDVISRHAIMEMIHECYNLENIFNREVSPDIAFKKRTEFYDDFIEIACFIFYKIRSYHYVKPENKNSPPDQKLYLIIGGCIREKEKKLKRLIQRYIYEFIVKYIFDMYYEILETEEVPLYPLNLIGAQNHLSNCYEEEISLLGTPFFCEKISKLLTKKSIEKSFGNSKDIIWDEVYVNAIDSLNIAESMIKKMIASYRK